MSDFTYNGKSNDELGIKVINIRMSLFGGMKHELVDLPGVDEPYLFPQKPRKREISIDCVLSQNSNSELETKTQEIVECLAQNIWKKLELHTKAGKHFKAIVIEPVDEEHIATNKLFTINFVALPYAYGTEQTINFANDAATVANAGTYSAPAIIEATFTGAATEFKVTLGTEYIRVVHGFVLNDTLKIDTGTGAVLINGTRAMDKLDWQNSIFFELAKGDNTLNITPTGKCTATVKHTPRWL